MNLNQGGGRSDPLSLTGSNTDCCIRALYKVNSNDNNERKQSSGIWTAGPASNTPTQPLSPVTVLGSSCVDRAQRPPQQGRHVEGVRRNALENINTGQ